MTKHPPLHWNAALSFATIPLNESISDRLAEHEGFSPNKAVKPTIMTAADIQHDGTKQNQILT